MGRGPMGLLVYAMYAVENQFPGICFEFAVVFVSVSLTFRIPMHKFLSLPYSYGKNCMLNIFFKLVMLKQGNM